MLENAELIKQYAEDAKHISEPWLLYEFRWKESTKDWVRCTSPILWQDCMEYRRVSECTFQPHVHHKLMQQYAEDVEHYNNPNSMWQFYNDGEWCSLEGRDKATTWNPNLKYRRVLVINGIHVPAPETEPPREDTKFYVPSLVGNLFGQNVITSYWDSDSQEHSHLLEKGIVHLTREAALTHAEALLSLTQRTV